MTKKKCADCRHLTMCGKTELKKSKTVCKQWTRNADLWLDIPPTEPGWYWGRRFPKTEPMIIDVRDEIDAGGDVPGFHYWEEDRGDWVTINKLTGEFQGPITPKEDTK